MEKWTYKVISLFQRGIETNEKIEAALDREGSNGWELVSVASEPTYEGNASFVLAFLKKRISDS